MTELTAETLLNLGFRDIGRWAPARREGCLDYILDGANAQADGLLLNARNSLYAFAEGDAVKYIGKTARTIRERFVEYPPGEVNQLLASDQALFATWQAENAKQQLTIKKSEQ